MKARAENRKARFDVAVERVIEAGLVLTGDEIKSIRAGRVQLTGAYIKLLSGRPVVIGMHLSVAHDPERTRALLLSRRELAELAQELDQAGKTAVALDVHVRRGWAKLSIGVGTGRKRYDKRQLLKERDIEREERR
jgi:SsrA-binding protein